MIPRRTRRQLARTARPYLVAILLAATILLTHTAVLQIQNDPLSPITWFLTLAAAAALIAIVKVLDRARP